jgi:hypothetical protein
MFQFFLSYINNLGAAEGVIGLSAAGHVSMYAWGRFRIFCPSLLAPKPEAAPPMQLAPVTA